MNRLRAFSVVTLVAVVAIVAAAGFELGFFNGPGAKTTQTTTIPSRTSSSQAQQVLSITKVGNETNYSFDFCHVSNGTMPLGWSSVRSKPGWSVQGCEFAYTGNSTSHVGAYFTGLIFSNFTYSLSGISLGYCPSNPSGSLGGKLPPELIMTFRQQNTLKPNEYSFHLSVGKAQLIKETNGTSTVLASEGPLGPGSDPLGPSGRYSMTVVVSGDSIRASWYGPLANGGITQGSIAASDPTFAKGFIGVATYNCNAAYNDIQLTVSPG